MRSGQLSKRIIWLAKGSDAWTSSLECFNAPWIGGTAFKTGADRVGSRCWWRLDSCPRGWYGWPIGRSKRYSKIKKLSHPTDSLHVDSLTYMETGKWRFFKFWGHLGTAHRGFLKVVKSPFFSTYGRQNSMKNKEISYMALKSAFLDRFWWNLDLYPLCWSRQVQLWWENVKNMAWTRETICLKYSKNRQIPHISHIADSVFW